MANPKKGKCSKKRSKLKKIGRQTTQTIKSGKTTSVVMYRDEYGRYCAPENREKASERKKKVQKERRKARKRKRSN